MASFFKGERNANFDKGASRVYHAVVDILESTTLSRFDPTRVGFKDAGGFNQNTISDVFGVLAFFAQNGSAVNEASADMLMAGFPKPNVSFAKEAEAATDRQEGLEGSVQSPKDGFSTCPICQYRFLGAR